MNPQCIAATTIHDECCLIEWGSLDDSACLGAVWRIEPCSLASEPQRSLTWLRPCGSESPKHWLTNAVTRWTCAHVLAVFCNICSACVTQAEKLYVLVHCHRHYQAPVTTQHSDLCQTPHSAFREQALLKAVTDNEMVSMMLGNVKLAMPGLNKTVNKGKKAKKK